jgi:hypothetical protein
VSGIRPQQLSLGIVVAGIVLHVAKLLSGPPGFLLDPSPSALRPFHIGVVAAAVLAAVGLLPGERLGKTAFALLVCVHLALGAWIIHYSPSPGIDVFVYQDDALDALLEGTNPYEIDFPEAFPGTYPEHLVVDGRVRGYPYPPLTLLVGLLGKLLAQDMRYAYLVALELAALLIAFARPGRLGRAAGAFFLLTPGLFVVLQLSWTEPVAILFFSATIFAACRRWRRALPVLFGLALGAKQYMVLTAAVVHKLFGLPFDRRRHVQRLLITASTVALVFLPWLMWGPKGFWTGIVVFPLATPFREDSISFPAALVLAGGPELPSWLGLAVPAAVWFLARKAPWTPAGYSAAAALLLCSSFAWSGHSFSNYYFLVLGVLCCAVASASPAIGEVRVGAQSFSSENEEVL